MSVAKWISAFPVISQHRLCLLGDAQAECLWFQHADMAPPTEKPLQYFALLVRFERDEQSGGRFLFGGDVVRGGLSHPACDFLVEQGTDAHTPLLL